MGSTRKGIGYNPIDGKVYLGRQNREKGMWVGDKEDISEDFLNVLMQWLEDNGCREIKNGKGETTNLLLNIVDDQESLMRTISFLNKRVKEMSDAQ